MLQGSLDNFAIDEVLTLLSTTQKTGRLAISGDRGTGSLWLETGGVVGGEASNLDDEAAAPDVMFELLRFESGSFLFTMDDRLDSPGVKADVAALLGDAQNRITEWRTIEAVVPSLSHELWLTRTLQADEVLLSRRDWDAVVGVGEGNTVGNVCHLLGLGEVDGSRMIQGLIERGVLQIGEATGRQATEPTPESFATESFATESFATESFATESFATESFATENFATESFATENFATERAAHEGVTFEAPGAESGARFSQHGVGHDMATGFAEADELAGFAAPVEEFEFLDHAAMADLERERPGNDASIADTAAAHGIPADASPAPPMFPAATFGESLADQAPAVAPPSAPAPIVEPAPTFESPVAQAPAFQAPIAEVPVFDVPKFDLPEVDIPAFDVPAFDASGADAPLVDPTPATNEPAARPFDTGPAFGAQPPARPPMPAPPTIGPDGAIMSPPPPPPPAFADASDASEFGELGDDDDEASLLMRYLKSDTH
ncbi:MAG: DUF4388 domain-containing protein [Acidimicrobiales bacterium]